MIIRPRRIRSSPAIRSLVEEAHLHVSDMIYPLFVMPGDSKKEEIQAMPGQSRLTLDHALELAFNAMELGIKGVCLFPVIPEGLKSRQCYEAYAPEGFYQDVIRTFKGEIPELLVMTDIALDPYSIDGHDGLFDSKSGKILNDETLALLAKMAVVQAMAGADILGPSDMMDGRVGVIREALEESDYRDTMIMSYTAKYASAFYGPFREALSSAPKSGNKLSYQMNPANRREALIEAREDEREGADILMVKPALSYLDVISDLRRSSSLPIAAYNVSGEYSMIKAAGMKGYIDEKKVMMETLLSMKRAGADIILTYFAIEAASLMREL